MDWTQVITMIGAISAFNWYFVSRIDKDVAKIESKMDAFEKRMDGHARRIDQLYTMFVDLLKEKK